MSYFLSAIIAVVISFGSAWGWEAKQAQAPLSPQVKAQMQAYIEQATKAPIFGTTQPIAGVTYNLAGSGISSSATSITLSSFTLPQNGYKIQNADLSSTFYITLEPGNSTRQEIVSCTIDTQNSNGSATFTGCTRGLSPVQPYTASSSLMFSHGGGTQVIFSNPPQFYNEFAQLGNNQTVTGTWTFSNVPPQISTTAANPFDAVNYQTLLATAISGAGTSTFAVMGISQLATDKLMASSTASSTQGRPLVLSSKFSTTTPGIQCQNGIWNCIPVANSAGKLEQQWLNLTQVFNFTGGMVVSASSTFNASTTLQSTTTIAAKTGAALILNGVQYFLTAIQGTAGSILKNDGAGNLSWSNPTRYAIMGDSLVSIGTGVGGYATSTVQLVVPANVIISSSTIDIYGTIQGTANGSGSNTYTLWIKSSTGATFGNASFSPSTSIAGKISFHALIVATSTTNQETFIQGVNRDSSTGFDDLSSTNFSNINTAAGVTITVAEQVTTAANNSNASIEHVSYVLNQ